MRFAGLGKRTLDYLGRVLVPRNEAGEISKAQMALEYGGNGLAALFSGAAFGGGNPGDSLAIGAEDLGIGLLGALGGRVAGDRMGKLLKLRSPQALDMARLGGSMVTEMGVGFGAPRPVMEGIMRKQQQQAEAAQRPAVAAPAAAPAPLPAPAQGGFVRQQFGPSPLELPADYGAGRPGLATGGSGDEMFARFLAQQPKEVQDLVLQSMGV
jgi:hypothetical protein